MQAQKRGSYKKKKERFNTEIKLGSNYSGNFHLIYFKIKTIVGRNLSLKAFFFPQDNPPQEHEDSLKLCLQRKKKKYSF